MARTSWVPVPADSDFSLANLPFGVITTARTPEPHPAVAIGEHALDLALFAAAGGFSGLPSLAPRLAAIFAQPTLNAFAALGRPAHRAVRAYLQDVRAADTARGALLRDDAALRARCLVPLADAAARLPLAVGDYTDFYAGKNHAFNVGVLFRGAANALQPNYTHLPVGYHGRASSVVVSGTPVRRPWGQVLPPDAAAAPADKKAPEWAPSRRLDIELELGAFVCVPNALGEGVRVGDADSHVFGYVLMNDWSARDIQAWEYVPLGPFNSKNFATTISAWVVLADALEPFRAAGIKNENEVLPYMKPARDDDFFNINLEVDIRTSGSSEPTTVTRTSARNLLWSFPQMIAHHTAGGCPMNPGDLLGSGTISGTEPGSQGSLLELTNGGKSEITLPNGQKRKFLNDGDEVSLRGWCGEGAERVGFGSCVGQIAAPWKDGYPS